MRILEVALTGTIGTIDMGPVSTVILELSNRFAAQGHTVILADVAGNKPRSLLHYGIQVVEVSGIPQSRTATATGNRVSVVFRRWHNYYNCIRQLISRIDLSTVDVVHTHAPIATFLLQRLFRVRCVYTAHTPTWCLGKNGQQKKMGQSSFIRPRLDGGFHAWIERDVIKGSKLTVALGNYLKAGVPDASIDTIPNGLDLAAWPQIDKTAARQALGIAAEDFVVLFTGRISPVKGIDVLLDAVNLLAPALSHLKVLIIGPLSGTFHSQDERLGPYSRSVIDAAKGLPVSFLGFINNRDVRFKQYLAAADVFVLPSRREPQGLVVLESLAMGTPVIGSTDGGIPDMVSPDVGCLFPPEDVNALAACIRQLHDNPQRLEDMRQAARARVQLHYSWDNTAERYLAAFARSLTERRPRAHY